MACQKSCPAGLLCALAVVAVVGSMGSRLPLPQQINIIQQRWLQDTVVAIRCHGTKVVVTSMHPDKFADCTYDTDPAQVGATAPHFNCTASCGQGLRGMKVFASCFNAIKQICSRLMGIWREIYAQEVDTSKHKWANYFMAAYKVYPQP